MGFGASLGGSGGAGTGAVAGAGAGAGVLAGAGAGSGAVRESTWLMLVVLAGPGEAVSAISQMRVRLATSSIESSARLMRLRMLSTGPPAHSARWITSMSVVAVSQTWARLAHRRRAPARHLRPRSGFSGGSATGRGACASAPPRQHDLWITFMSAMATPQG